MRLVPLALLLLAGCTSTPAVKVETVTVKVPTPVSCVHRADLPQEPPSIGIIPPDARQAADLLGSKVMELRGWGHKQAALLLACTID